MYLRILTLTLTLLFSSSLLIGQTSLEAIAFENGSFQVGFTHYMLTDSTRTYRRESDWSTRNIPRPIPVSLWYPSTHTKGGEPRQIIDYMEILKEEEEWENLPNEFILNWFYYPNTPENRQHLPELTNAFNDLPPAKGSFPAIVYAPSFQASSIENFALCEYLASHGYVVISSPSRGTETRLMEGGTEKDMESQARDIELLVKVVGQLPYVNPEKIATMGFSFGGLSHVLSQMRNEGIKAIVSLDGSIKYQYQTLKKSPFFNLEKVDVPFIHMAQKDIPEQVLLADNIDPTLNTQFTFYDSLILQ